MSDLEEKPRYVHDCSQCIFLGPYESNNKIMDLYYCMEADVYPTVVARESSEGGDYRSGLSFGLSGVSAPLAEAVKRARERGLSLIPKNRSAQP